MRQHTTLSNLTDEELLRHADNERDALTTTEIEIELAGRFAELVENPPLPKNIQDALDNTSIESEDLPEILKVLDEFFATDAKTLRAKLKRANDFYDIANDAGDVIERLSTLVTSTL
jgi:hypothetical protein